MTAHVPNLKTALTDCSKSISWYIGFLTFEAARLGGFYRNVSYGREHCQGARTRPIAIQVPGPNSELNAGTATTMMELPDEDYINSCSRHAQWDYYRMQRVKAYWERFLRWVDERRRIADQPANQIMPGYRLSGEKNSFVKENMLMRPVFDFPVDALPEETVARTKRGGSPRDCIADSILGSLASDTFTFQIETRIRAHPDSFSQVFSGHIISNDLGQNHNKSGLLCLKLFDERYFPVHGVRDNSNGSQSEYGLNWTPWTPSRERLEGWKTAEDFARREEAAYNTLKEFQGSIVPHCYGIHHVRHGLFTPISSFNSLIITFIFLKFMLPGGYRCIGMLMEMVDGSHVIPEDFSAFSKEEQKEIVSSLLTLFLNPYQVHHNQVIQARHAMRILLYAQISQPDWHGGQILIQRRQGPNDPQPKGGDVPFRVVFLDFAFSKQIMDLDCTPLSGDRNHVRLLFHSATLCQDWDMVEAVWGYDGEYELL